MTRGQQITTMLLPNPVYSNGLCLLDLPRYINDRDGPRRLSAAPLLRPRNLATHRFANLCLCFSGYSTVASSAWYVMYDPTWSLGSTLNTMALRGRLWNSVPSTVSPTSES